jgi:hypothetical protein
VCQELYELFLAHYAVRVHLAEAAGDAGVDPDRLSFSAGVFVLTELLDLALLERIRAAGPPGLTRAPPAGQLS